MNKLKLLERLVEKETEYNIYSAIGGIPECFESYDEFLLKWKHTQNLVLDLYNKLKIKFPKHPLIKKLDEDDIIEKCSLPLPPEDITSDYCL